jgi:RimJ/RimL family protein N-acetyltransferase
LAELRRFLASLPWVADEPSVEGSEIFCRNAHANFHARKDFPFLLIERSRSRLVGVCGLHRPDWNTPKFEVGYWCRTSESGDGYITEAVSAVCRYAIEHFGAVRLEAITDEQNMPSRRVAERCGFTLEGTLRSERRAPDGSLRNTCVYARLAGGAR